MMRRDTTLAPEGSAIDPETIFRRPADVVERSVLTIDQKINVLEKWLFSVRARIDAVSEGMNSHNAGAYAKDVDVQREIEKLLATLRPKPRNAADQPDQVA
jgi:hypothetical protein